MRKFPWGLGVLAGLALIALAASTRFIDEGAGRATALELAGGVFTIALAVYVRD